jgi:flagellar biosynthetic protein FliP
MTQSIAALLIVAAAILLLRAVLGALPAGRGRSRRSLRVVESCALSHRQRLFVVEADGERLLVGSAENQLTLLRRLPATPAPEPEASAEPDASAELPARLGWRRLAGLSFLALGAVLVPLDVAAQDLADVALQAASALGDAGEPDQISNTLWLVGIMTAVSVAPSLLLMATCFTRIVIVLAFLRQALGIQQLPPSQVIVGLALFLTLFVMAPVGERVRVEAVDPYLRQEIEADVALDLSLVPVRDFLGNFTREADLALFLEISETEPPENLEDVPLTMLMPAYMLSELRTAFEIGFMIYLPFLVVDLMVASMLISMGMIVLPPIVVSLPFKLMLFVLLDGWNLVVSSLVTGLR